MIRSWMVVAAVAVTSACALRLGGSGPVEYTAIAVDASANANAQQTGEQIRSVGSDIALIATDRDSVWLASVATAAGLTLSGPSTSSERSLAFLTNLEMIGDTSLVLPVGNSGQLHMHDALFQVDDNRIIDLMLVRPDDGTDLREATRTLLEYIATDVGANAAIVLGVDAHNAQDAAAIATMLRAAFGNAAECAEAQPQSLRLLYGPAARLRCSSGREAAGAGSPVVLQLVVQR